MYKRQLYVFLGIVVDNFNWSIDRLLLTWIHGTTAVTVYTIAAQLNTFYLACGNAISNVMTDVYKRQALTVLAAGDGGGGQCACRGGAVGHGHDAAPRCV